MRTLTVYPFDISKRFFKDKMNQLKAYEKVVLIALATSEMEEYQSDNCRITKNWKLGIEEGDEILILPGLGKDDMYKEVITYALKLEKKVMISKSAIRCEEYEKYYIYENELDLCKSKYMYDIDIPVITVMSLGENCEKFELQLLLNDYFNNRGYKILQIGSNDLCDFFGIKKMPGFMYGELSYNTKIKLFNRYIYEEVRREKPDLIIIGCSGGIMPYNRYVDNYFGEIPMVVSKALDIDINLLSLYLTKEGDVDKKYMDSLDIFCKENYGCEINFFAMSNIYACYNREKNSQEYMFFDNGIVSQCISELNENKLFDKNNMGNILKIFSDIEEILKTEFEVV